MYGKTATFAFLSVLLACKYLTGDASDGFLDKILVLDACEYIKIFLNFSPNLGAILNVYYDHLDSRLNDSKYRSTFELFIRSFWMLVYNGDLCVFLGKNRYKFGIKKDNDYDGDFICKNKG